MFKQKSGFFLSLSPRLTQRVTPLLKELKEGLAHLRPGPVARRHACECLEKPALQQKKLVPVLVRARAQWRCGKASSSSSLSVQGRVQRRFGGQSAEGLRPWRVGFVETSTRVTQAYKERGPSPASGRGALRLRPGQRPHQRQATANSSKWLATSCITAQSVFLFSSISLVPSDSIPDPAGGW